MEGPSLRARWRSSSRWAWRRCRDRSWPEYRLRPVEWVITHWRLAAVAALFFLGMAMRRWGRVPLSAGKTLLNLVFNVGLPLLVLGALGSVTLERQHALLPAAAVGTVLVCWAAAAFAARRFVLAKRSEGAM